MSVSETEDVKELQQLEDKTTDTDLPVHEQKGDLVEEQPKQSPDHEEKALKKKYGGMLPKKHPLISKDHERAFFDSADWALGKQQGGGGAQKPKGAPLEALRPKLEPTQHQQLRSRKSVYAPADDDDTNEDGNHEDQRKPTESTQNTILEPTESTQNTMPPDAEDTEESNSSCH